MVELFFGLGAENVHSVKRIARRLNMSRKDVKLQLASGLSKLHSIKALRELLD